MKVLVPLAQGFEEIEAVTIVDVLRRADVEVITASLSGESVTGSHAISIKVDVELEQVNMDSIDSIVLPGGMPGSRNLQNSEVLEKCITDIVEKGGILGAICAAPIVYGKHGHLKGKSATCYPGFEKELDGAKYIEEPVVVDGKMITGRGPGCAIPFALKLVEIYVSKEKSDELKEAMQVYWM